MKFSHVLPGTAAWILLFAGAAAAQSAPARRPGSPMERWKQYSEEERNHLREIYKNFKKLSPEEQSKLRERAKDLWRERDMFEKKLSSEDRAVLDALGSELKDEFLKRAMVEVIRGRHRGIESMLPKERILEALKLPVGQREESLKKLAEDALGQVIQSTLAFAEQKKLINSEERARIAAMSPRAAVSEVLEIRKKGFLLEMERHPERFDNLTDAEKEELKAMPTEKFFSRIEALRTVPRVFGDRRERDHDHDARDEHERRERGQGYGDRFRRPPDFDDSRFIEKMRERMKQELIEHGATPEEADAKVKQFSSGGRRFFKGPPPPRGESGPSSRKPRASER
jgi:hypothetical protein